MKIMRLLVVLLLCSILVVGCGNSSDVPQAPQEVAIAAQYGEFTLTWRPPANWGSGSHHCYRVEFYDGAEWNYLGTVTETVFTYEVLSSVNSMGNRFSVRAETSLGHSDWVITDSFDIKNPSLDDQEEFLRIEQGDQELAADEVVFTLVAKAPDGFNNISWSANVPWLSLPSSSEPNEEIEVRAVRNDTGTGRVGIITARGVNELTATIIVTQAGAEADPTLAVTPSTVRFDQPGATSLYATATVTGAEDRVIAWEANADWLSVQASSAAGVAIRINVAENVTSNSRSGAITVSAGAGLRTTITVTQAGRRGPGAPNDISLSLADDECTLTWTAPGNWGTGDGRLYRVEFYDGDTWFLVGEVSETQFVYNIPVYVSIEVAKFRVRAETSHGNSGYIESDSIVNEYSTAEPVITDDQLTLTARRVYYEDNTLVLLAWIANGYGSAVADIHDVIVRVYNAQGEIALGGFGAMDGLVIGAGDVVEWRFEFPVQGNEVNLRVGISTEFRYSLGE